jgi:2-oxoglutarate dehydrogenase E1 component
VGKVLLTLTEIIAHLDAIYCQHIGVEYMYKKARDCSMDTRKVGENDNLPDFSIDQKNQFFVN